MGSLPGVFRRVPRCSSQQCAGGGCTGALWSGTIAVGGSAAGQDSAMASLQDSIPSLFPQAGSKLTPTGRTENSASIQQNQQNEDNQQIAAASGGKETRGAAQGALWGCIALVLGLLVAAWGG